MNKLVFHKPLPDRIMLGVSGGVDSSVAALLLRQAGCEVFGLTMITQPEAQASVADAAAVCKSAGIEHIVVDVQAKFAETIIADFVYGYTAGRTPNPCILCNPTIKFDVLYKYAAEYNCKGVATGHYANVRKLDNGRFAMEKAPVGFKDQSYFLNRLSQSQLAGLFFPLGSFQKSEVRQIAQDNGLLTADGKQMGNKPDSQDNCFIPDSDYASYIRRYLNMHNKDLLYLTEPGDVCDFKGNVLGTHRGLINFTIGQRKGFNVKTTERLFVLDRDIEKNILIVGDHEKLLRKEVIVKDIVYSGLAGIDKPTRLLGKIRHSAKEMPCTVSSESGNRLRAVFDEPVVSPVTGQSCVFYLDDLIMAGGFIE